LEDPNVERGTIASWNNEKGFGFITTPNRKHRVFAGVRGARAFYEGDDGPVLGEYHPEPGVVRVGMTVVFEPQASERGEAARWWAPAASLADAEDRCKNRPLYRMVERKGKVKEGADPKVAVLWEGKNLRSLKQAFPFHEAHENKNHALWFEVKSEDGWRKCGDPRACHS
jgi:hypothetical protein